MRIVITGYKQHGKDTFCDMLNLPYISSSALANELFVFDALKDKYGYKTHDDCHADRFNRRKEWFDLIREYNTPDGTALGRQLFSRVNVYNGLRNIEELTALRNADLVDVVVWVDSSLRLPPESADSCTIGRDDCDIVIPNNQSLDELQKRADTLRSLLSPVKRFDFA